MSDVEDILTDEFWAVHDYLVQQDQESGPARAVLLKCQCALGRAATAGKNGNHCGCTASLETLVEALKLAAGHCQCCLKESPLVMDHCHRTGRFRGWICGLCNSGIGFLGDEPGQAIERISRYITDSDGSHPTDCVCDVCILEVVGKLTRKERERMLGRLQIDKFDSRKNYEN